MKKILSLIFILLLVNQAFSQDEDILKSKKGLPVLPQKGDYAVGISATPFFNFFGNIFNGNTFNQAPVISASGTTTFTGKYFKSNQTAYRIGFTLNISSLSRENAVPKQQTFFNPAEFTVDEAKQFRTLINLQFGVEKRRGVGRLQGIYGFSGGFGLSGVKDEYKYANEMNTGNSNPISTQWSGLNPNTQFGTSSRVIENNTGISFSLSASTFVGFEYFILPKISIGGELTYQLRFSTEPNSKRVTQFYDFDNDIVRQSTAEGNFGQGAGLELGNLATGALSVFVYF